MSETSGEIGGDEYGQRWRPESDKPPRANGRMTVGEFMKGLAHAGEFDKHVAMGAFTFDGPDGVDTGVSVWAQIEPKTLLALWGVLSAEVFKTFRDVGQEDPTTASLVMMRTLAESIGEIA